MLVSGRLLAIAITTWWVPGLVSQQGKSSPPPILSNGKTFATWEEFLASAQPGSFARCGSVFDVPPAAELTQLDCTVSFTNTDPSYDPGPTHNINVVFHVLRGANGVGDVTNQLINSQISVLNQTFASAGITFTLDPTNIKRPPFNDTFFNDGGQYWATLAVDPDNFLNIYSNNILQASNNTILGYVPYLPQEGTVGESFDRIVLDHTIVGAGNPLSPPGFAFGFTGTHEVGHYLGLYHIFTGGCLDLFDCFFSSDLICDTPPQIVTFGGVCPTPPPPWPPVCPGGSSPLLNNFMGFMDDGCMIPFPGVEGPFTSEQINRMRCTLESWRADLFAVRPDCEVAAARPRNMGSNADIYRATAPVLGQSMTLELQGPRHSPAVAMGRLLGCERHLANGQVLLVDLHSPLLFRQAFAAPQEKVVRLVPSLPELCGLEFVSQAFIFGGGTPLILTNAIDMTLGF